MHRPLLPVRDEVESRADMREAGLNAITFASSAVCVRWFRRSCQGLYPVDVAGFAFEKRLSDQ